MQRNYTFKFKGSEKIFMAERMHFYPKLMKNPAKNQNILNRDKSLALDNLITPLVPLY